MSLIRLKVLTESKQRWSRLHFHHAIKLWKALKDDRSSCLVLKFLLKKEKYKDCGQNGYFEDSAVVKTVRCLIMQVNGNPVYPYLQDGTLDQVFDYKAKLSGKMTAAEYKVVMKRL